MRFLPFFFIVDRRTLFVQFDFVVTLLGRSTMSYPPDCRLNRTRSSRFEGGRRALPVVREKLVVNPTVSTKRVLGHRPPR